MNCKRKTIAMLFTLLAIVLVFAGCTSGNTEVTTTAKAESTTGSKNNTNSLLPKTDSSVAAIVKAKTGDSIKYGSYNQDKDTANGKETITWKVLAVENGKALLISDMVLDCKPYNETRQNTAWETSTLRTWLNSDFMNSAFNQTEQKAVVLSTIPNKDNAQYKTDGGNDTQDKVFCLSVDEAKLYYKNDDLRIAKCSDYAGIQGAYSFEKTVNKIKEKDAGWWLRSPGHGAVDASDVYYNGKIHYDYVDYSSYIGVRPAMWIDLKSEIFKSKAPSTTTAQSSTTLSSSTTAPSTTAVTTTVSNQ